MRVTFFFAVLAAHSALADKSVRFIAPEPLRETVKASLEALKFEAVDDSAIDQALFTDPEKAGQALAKGTFPPELVQDFADGQKICAKRKKNSTARCFRQLVRAVWQRHLNRTAPEQVLEVRPGIDFGDKGWIVEAAAYEPSSPWVLANNSVAATELLAAQGTAQLLIVKKRGIPGTRPNSSALPTAAQPKDPSLLVGEAQQPGAVKVPEDCVLPPMTISPAQSPFAKSLLSVWKASRASAKGATVSCNLSFKPSGPNASLETLELSCMRFLIEFTLYEGGPDLSDRAFHGQLARAFADEAVIKVCQPLAP